MSDLPLPGPLLFEETVAAGGMNSWLIRRHTTVRFTALEAGANLALLAYNRENPLDRLNLPDTLKAQHTAKLTRGHVLMSDMGRVLLSITSDGCGWNDPLGGHGNATLVREKYGEARYLEHRNAWHRNAHDNFLIELAKHGLGKRDLAANVNFFSRLDVDDAGRMHFHPGNAPAGAWVDLRAEMDALVIVNTCQHPLDPNPNYAPVAVRAAFYQTSPPGPDDFCRNFRPENARAFTLTERP
jgi:urea carboxylase-associated protein 2